MHSASIPGEGDTYTFWLVTVAFCLLIISFAELANRHIITFSWVDQGAPTPVGVFDVVTYITNLLTLTSLTGRSHFPDFVCSLTLPTSPINPVTVPSPQVTTLLTWSVTHVCFPFLLCHYYYSRSLCQSFPSLIPKHRVCPYDATSPHL